MFNPLEKVNQKVQTGRPRAQWKEKKKKFTFTNVTGPFPPALPAARSMSSKQKWEDSSLGVLTC